MLSFIRRNSDVFCNNSGEILWLKTVIQGLSIILILMFISNIYMCVLYMITIKIYSWKVYIENYKKYRKYYVSRSLVYEYWSICCGVSNCPSIIIYELYLKRIHKRKGLTVNKDDPRGQEGNGQPWSGIS